MSQSRTATERAKIAREQKKQYMSADANQFRSDVNTYANLAIRGIEAATSAANIMQRHVKDGGDVQRIRAADILVGLGSSQLSVLEVLQAMKQVIYDSGARGLSKSRTYSTSKFVRLSEQGRRYLDGMIEWIRVFFASVSNDWQSEKGGAPLANLLNYVEQSVAQGYIFKEFSNRIINIYLAFFGILKLTANDETFKINISDTAGFDASDNRKYYNTIVRALPLYLIGIAQDVNPITTTLYRSTAASIIRKRLGTDETAASPMDAGTMQVLTDVADATKGTKVDRKFNDFYKAYMSGELNEEDYTQEELNELMAQIKNVSIYNRAKMVNSLRFLLSVIARQYGDRDENTAWFYNEYDTYVQDPESIVILPTREAQAL